MGAWRPKHVEWPCRNKTCTVLHQVGVSFDLYCDARKHKIKILIRHFSKPAQSNIAHTNFFFIEFLQEEINLMLCKRHISVTVLCNSDIQHRQRSSEECTDGTQSTDIQSLSAVLSSWHGSRPSYRNNIFLIKFREVKLTRRAWLVIVIVWYLKLFRKYSFVQRSRSTK